jgi:hypothetical protein
MYGFSVRIRTCSCVCTHALSFRGIYQKPVPEEEIRFRFAMMPMALREALMPFQREGVLYGLQHQGRVLIADEVSSPHVLAEHWVTHVFW